MKRALVFDFDGLILDTEWPEYQAWKKVFEGLGLQLPIQDWRLRVVEPTRAQRPSATAVLA